MFSLSSIIEAKKRKLNQATESPSAKRQKKYRSRREIEEEKEREQKLLAEEKKKENIQQEPSPVVDTTTETQQKSEEEQKPQYDREEVIKRLRQAGLVVTYFGETDREREQRWLKHDTESKEDFAYNKGTKNEFDDLMRNIDSNVEGEDDEGEEGNDAAQDDFLQTPIEKIFDGLDDLCDEDRVLLLFRRLLEEWKLETKANEETHKKTMQGKKLLATVRQSEIYLRPLFKSLKQRTLSKDILENLTEVVKAIVTRNYTEAGNFYIQMAVGNAPWPIGVTMVGIHERSAREKIFSNQVAHVLNDETQRKYIQSVYRLMKFCQKKYPAPPSRSIG